MAVQRDLRRLGAPGANAKSLQQRNNVDLYDAEAS